MDMQTKKILEIKEVLDNVLLPLDASWCISSVKTDDESGEIFLHLEYKLDYAEVDGVRYPIYDFRKARSWRHLDLWQYQTYLTARIPRYKDNSGKCKSDSVSWADTCSRLSILLEKKL